MEETSDPRDDACRTCHSSDNGGVGHAQLNVAFMATMVGHPFVRGKGGLAYSLVEPMPCRTCCLQDRSGSSTACWCVFSLLLSSGGSASQCAPVGPSSPRWNDQRNDQRARALVQVATQISLLAAQSTVVDSQLDPRWSGYCSPVAATEPVGVIAVWRPGGIGPPPPARPSRGEEVLMP